jgi:hypothetical protein
MKRKKNKKERDLILRDIILLFIFIVVSINDIIPKYRNENIWFNWVYAIGFLFVIFTLLKDILTIHK